MEINLSSLRAANTSSRAMEFATPDPRVFQAVTHFKDLVAAALASQEDATPTERKEGALAAIRELSTRNPWLQRMALPESDKNSGMLLVQPRTNYPSVFLEPRLEAPFKGRMQGNTVAHSGHSPHWTIQPTAGNPNDQLNTMLQALMAAKPLPELSVYGSSHKKPQYLIGLGEIPGKVPSHVDPKNKAQVGEVAMHALLGMANARLASLTPDHPSFHMSTAIEVAREINRLLKDPKADLSPYLAVPSILPQDFRAFVEKELFPTLELYLRLLQGESSPERLRPRDLMAPFEASAGLLTTPEDVHLIFGDPALGLNRSTYAQEDLRNVLTSMTTKKGFNEARLNLGLAYRKAMDTKKANLSQDGVVLNGNHTPHLGYVPASQSADAFRRYRFPMVKVSTLREVPQAISKGIHELSVR